MERNFNPYDAAAFIRDLKERHEAKRSMKLAQTAEIAQTIDRMEAEGNPVGPWDPLVSKLLNPRIR